MPDDAAEFLSRSGQEPWDIFKRQQRNIECVAKTHEARAFDGRIDVEASRKVRRLIGHHADRAPIHARESDHDILGEVLVHFEELAIVYDAMDDVVDVV